MNLSCGIWSDKEISTIENIRAKIWSVAKIFVVTGLTWFLEMISFIIHYVVEDKETYLMVGSLL